MPPIEPEYHQFNQCRQLSQKPHYGMESQHYHITVLLLNSVVFRTDNFEHCVAPVKMFPRDPAETLAAACAAAAAFCTSQVCNCTCGWLRLNFGCCCCIQLLIHSNPDPNANLSTSAGCGHCFPLQFFCVDFHFS